MGLWEFLQQWPRRRTVVGVAASIVLHAVVVAMVMWAGRFPLTPRWMAKPGDALIVELPKPEESATPGRPGVRTPPRVAPVAPRERPAAPTPPPRREPAPARQERLASTPPPPASPEPRPAAPISRAPERQSPTEPAPRVLPATPHTPDPSGTAPSEERAALKPSDTVPAETVPAPTGVERQVASVPPGAGAPAPPTDIRHALRRGGGGSGRGGIEGDPIALDSKDSRYSDFLEKVRQMIKAQWGYPCVKNLSTRECEYLSAQLIVEFGILKSGELQFVDVVRSSGYEIYDGYATTAIRLASPYPKVPPELMAQMRAGSSGAIILAKFNYIAETSLTNIR